MLAHLARKRLNSSEFGCCGVGGLIFCLVSSGLSLLGLVFGSVGLLTTFLSGLFGILRSFLGVFARFLGSRLDLLGLLLDGFLSLLRGLFNLFLELGSVMLLLGFFSSFLDLLAAGLDGFLNLLLGLLALLVFLLLLGGLLDLISELVLLLLHMSLIFVVPHFFLGVLDGLNGLLGSLSLLLSVFLELEGVLEIISSLGFVIGGAAVVAAASATESTVLDEALANHELRRGHMLSVMVLVQDDGGRVIEKQSEGEGSNKLHFRIFLIINDNKSN